VKSGSTGLGSKPVFKLLRTVSQNPTLTCYPLPAGSRFQEPPNTELFYNGTSVGAGTSLPNVPLSDSNGLALTGHGNTKALLSWHPSSLQLPVAVRSSATLVATMQQRQSVTMNTPY
jgi:hypothetical protein